MKESDARGFAHAFAHTHAHAEDESSTPRPGTERWNHNIHYGLELLEIVPVGARDALDVGCGEGWLVRELRQVVGHVVGIDRDEVSIAAAGESGKPEGVEYLAADFLSYPFELGSFDVVTAVASLHHMDERAALARLAELVRPGGTLAVVGLARSHSPLDFAYDAAGAVATRAHQRVRTHWETPAPKVWPPPHTYAEVRRFGQEVLPGSRFRRRSMWRYVLTWNKPAA